MIVLLLVACNVKYNHNSDAYCRSYCIDNLILVWHTHHLGELYAAGVVQGTPGVGTDIIIQSHCRLQTINKWREYRNEIDSFIVTAIIYEIALENNTSCQSTALKMIDCCIAVK